MANKHKQEPPLEASIPPELPPKRAGTWVRKLLKVVIIFVVLLIVSVGAFIAYAWLGSNEAPAATINDPKPKAQLQEQKKPPTVDPNAPVGVSVQSISSPTLPGSNVLLTARTKAGAVCTIIAEYNKVKSTDSGLMEKTADDYGMVTWSWAVDPGAPVGKWPVTVTCIFGEKSGVVVADLEVKTSFDE